MPATIIDGKKLAAEIREKVATEVKELKAKHGITPGLTVILVGENEASKIYTANKTKASEKAGIDGKIIRLKESTPEEELLKLIQKLNVDKKVHGILIQLPLPKQINTQKVLESVSPEKDVDGFHPYNLGRLMAGAPLFQPCTPLGIIRLLESINYDVKGKNATIVGRSNIVGKPVAMMLLARHATITMCHTKTTNLKEKVRSADLVIAAAGSPKMIKGEWIKEGACVIDVGMNRVDGKLCGDVDFDTTVKRAAFITPVPGGVGPMTIAMLLENTVRAAKLQELVSQMPGPKRVTPVGAPR